MLRTFGHERIATAARLLPPPPPPPVAAARRRLKPDEGAKLVVQAVRNGMNTRTPVPCRDPESRAWRPPTLRPASHPRPLPAVDRPRRGGLQSPSPLGDRLTVGHAALDRRIGVRIPVSQPLLPLGAPSGAGTDEEGAERTDAAPPGPPSATTTPRRDSPATATGRPTIRCRTHPTTAGPPQAATAAPAWTNASPARHARCRPDPSR